jgi:SAM-dependent methyltransferase
MSFFAQYPEFIDSDIRKSRSTTTVTAESLDKRCAALLPKWSIEGKSILDLGSCMGSFGHWALANGATHYTGVEIQSDFCDHSNRILGGHWDADKFEIINSDVLEFLRTTKNKYDIVVAAGVIHGYVDVVSLLKSICDVSTEYVVIESQECEEREAPTIQFKVYNMVSSNPAYPFSGWTSIISFNALRAVMNEYGYAMYGDRIYPEAILGSHDAYHDKIDSQLGDVYGLPVRYMVRYKKQHTNKNSLQYKIQNNKQERKQSFIKVNETVTIEKPVRWEFDQSVAQRFQDEATCNIPDYERVIDMCIDIADRKHDYDMTIVDVGSALGHTIEKFNNAGYKYVYGVESSQAMFDNSKYQAFIKISETFPTEWHPEFVMANWTLHFVNERKQYITDVYNSLKDNGVFVLSDKTPQSDLVKELYYDFKRSKGITDEYIYKKEEKLKGYMNLLPIDWYLDTLKEVGFNNVQIINSKFGFVTFYAEK